MRYKAEEMSTKLSRHFLNSLHVINVYDEEPIVINNESRNEFERSSPNGPTYSSVGSSVTGEKRTFSLIDLADSCPKQEKTLDEVSVYRLMNLAYVKEEGHRFLNEDHSVVEFLFDRKSQHPALYVAVALASYSVFFSCFSAIKLTVTGNRCNLSSTILEEILVIRSLTE